MTDFNPRRIFGGVLILLLCVGVCLVPGQTISLYSSRPTLVGARSAAFADASASDGYDVTSMYGNPATMVALLNTSVVLDHTQERIVNGMNENLAIPIPLRAGEVLALGFTVDHVGYVKNSPDFDFHVIQYGYDIAYAREIMPTFSVGGNLGVRYAKSTVSNLWGVNSTLGVYYSPSQEISYGAAVTGLGSGILYASDRTSTSLSSENLPRSLKVGVTLHFPEEVARRVFTISVANQKIFGQDGIIYMGGMELLVNRFLALRGGYRFEQSVGAVRLGLGFQREGFHLDWSVSPSKATDRSFHITASIPIWNKGPLTQ
jgi:hypothetical protein